MQNFFCFDKQDEVNLHPFTYELELPMAEIARNLGVVTLAIGMAIGEDGDEEKELIILETLPTASCPIPVPRRRDGNFISTTESNFLASSHGSCPE